MKLKRMDGRNVYDRIEDKSRWMEWSEFDKLPPEQVKGQMRRYKLEEPSFYEQAIASKLVNCFRLRNCQTLFILTDRSIVCDKSFGILAQTFSDQLMLDLRCCRPDFNQTGNEFIQGFCITDFDKLYQLLFPQAYYKGKYLPRIICSIISRFHFNDKTF